MAHLPGDQLVLVMGAGCSVEAPTSLKTGRQYSEELFTFFVDNGDIEGDLAIDHGDLSAVAQAVTDARGSQAPFVQGLPIESFRNARANNGTLILGALLREGIIKNAICLNFDLSASDGLRQVGADADVKTIDGPEFMTQFGARNLVYLHRNVNAAPDEWILTRSALDTAWKGKWEELIAQALLVVPIVVFAGVSARHGVFKAVLERLAKKLTVTRYLVDIAPTHDSNFATSMGVDEAHYLSMAWCEFMTALGTRANAAFLRDAEQHLNARQSEDAWLWDSVDCTALFKRLRRDTGLLEFGFARARWLFSREPYLPYRTLDSPGKSHLAELLIAIAILERETGATARVSRAGPVDLIVPGQAPLRIALRSGRGEMFSTELRSKIEDEYTSSPEPHLLPRSVIAGHARAGEVDRPARINITQFAASPHDVAVGPAEVGVHSLDNLLSHPADIAQTLIDEHGETA